MASTWCKAQHLAETSPRLNSIPCLPKQARNAPPTTNVHVARNSYHRRICHSMDEICWIRFYRDQLLQLLLATSNFSSASIYLAGLLMRIQENKINTRLLILLPDPSQKYLASSRTGCLTASSLSLPSPSSPDAGGAPALAARGAAASPVRPAGGRPRSRSGAGRPRRWPRRRIPVRCLLLAVCSRSTKP